ncbi:MAG: MFS transporter [Propionicimonas sp.]|nr:MFS transporter [Propionicimonas sp.]
MEATAHRIPPEAWKTAVLGGMASYLDGGALVTGGIALSLSMASFGMTEWDLGIMSGMLTGGLALGALLGGWLGDRFGRKRVLSIDLAVLAVGLALNMVAPHTAMLYVGIAITGLAMGTDLPPSIALVAESAPRNHRGKLVGLSQLLWVAGGAIAIIITTVLANLQVPDSVNARALWAHLFILTVVIWVLRRRLPESQEWLEEVGGDVSSAVGRGRAPRSGAVQRGQLRQLLPHLIPLLVVGAFYTIGNLAPNTGGQFGFFILTHVTGLPVATTSSILLAMMPLGLLLGVAFMRVVDTRWRYPVMVAAGLLQTFAYAVPAMLGVTATTYLIGSFAGITGAAFIGEGMYKVRVQEIFPTAVRATAQGATIFTCRILTALFALVTPALATYSLTALMWMLAGLSLTTLALAVWVNRLKSVQST